jgi:hypothetical protein
VTRPSEASVVPIRLVLDGRSGLTLWATPWEEDGEEWQAFLGAGSKVLLFTTTGDLREYLHSGDENDLTDHPSYKTLLRLKADQFEPEDGYDFDLDGVYDLAAGDPDPFAVSELSDLVDIVQRVAECCDDGTLLRVIEDSPEFSRLLADEVTYTGSEGDEQWSELGSAFERSWELVLDRLGGLVEWRGEPPADTGDDEDDDIEEVDVEGDDEDDAVEPAAAADADSDEDDEDDEDEDEDEDDEEDDDEDEEADTLWAEAGIIPISITLPTGTGYTLRTYVDDDAQFLGSDLNIDLFRTLDGLIAYCQENDEHDLADLDTWELVADGDADSLRVEPADADTYDLTAPGPEAVELARDIADYCQLDGVEAVLPARGEVAFDVWVAAVAEISSCIRWQD